MNWINTTWAAMTADGKGGVVASIAIFVLTVGAGLLRWLWVIVSRRSKADSDAVRELAKITLAEKQAEIAARKSARLEVKFIRGGESMRITNSGPSQAWDIGIGFPEGGETAIVDAQEAHEKFTHRHLDVGESLDVLCTVNEKTPVMVPAVLEWNDDGGKKSEARNLRVPTNPTNLSVRMVRDGPNDLHLAIRNGGPGPAREVQVQFPNGEPILMQMRDTPAFAVIEPDQEMEIPFRQYMEHAYQAIYSVALDWKDTHACRQEFQVSFPRT